MLEDEIRRRIENLRLILLEKGPPSHWTGAPARPLAVTDIDGAAEVENDVGRYIAIEGAADDSVSVEALEGAARILLGERRTLPAFVFMDLETTGFSSTPLFLAGTASTDAGTLKYRQLLARDYSEERAVIRALDNLIARHDFCITFNGKSFDMPYLRERAKYHRLDLRSSPGQYDLLHPARRMWKESLPNCRLATLERYVLGRTRVGDVPGWEVPCIYHEFVHTKDARKIKGVLRHNLVDVMSMAQLFVSLAEDSTC